MISPKSAHVEDPALQPFMSSSFDAAEFLNATLPSLQSARSAPQSPPHDVPLSELSTQTQTLLSHLSAHTTRLTDTLTQLTDEILRSGSRLTYEVEMLRGETLGVSEALAEGLQDDISRFVPEGLENCFRKPSHVVDNGGVRTRNSTLSSPKTPIQNVPLAQSTDPEYVTRLRTLTLVRNRLETVIKTFGDAMAWTFPPSELSVSSAFLSVSAPEPGSEAHSIEEKGQKVSKQLREEIADLLVKRSDPIDGVEAAARRVEELKELSKVWKGTAEDKARVKFVESLAKMVEDRHRELLRESSTDDRMGLKAETIGRAENSRSTDESTPVYESKAQSGYGFISQLQKIRGGL
jgi:hypothetical protein